MSDIIQETILRSQSVYNVAIATRGKKNIYSFTTSSNKYEVLLDRNHFEYSVKDHNKKELLKTDSFMALIDFLKTPLR